MTAKPIWTIEFVGHIANLGSEDVRSLRSAFRDRLRKVTYDEPDTLYLLADVVGTDPFEAIRTFIQKTQLSVSRRNWTGVDCRVWTPTSQT